MATTAEVNKFINMLAPIVVNICKSKSRKVLPSVCIAQACCETGYGTTERMMATNGLFGIKVGKNRVKFGKAWKGKSYSTKTKEYYNGSSTATEITDTFRAYDSIKDSVEDYYDMMGTCSRYSSAIGVTDYTKAIQNIIAAGYATDPTYIDTICSIIKKRDLTKYDDCMRDTAPSKKNNVAVENSITKTKHKLGEKIIVTRYYSNSNAEEKKAVIRCRPAVIIKIKEGTKHPYLVNTLEGILLGWTGDTNILENGKDNGEAYYTVVSGDTMSKIAKTYNTTVTKLLELNKSKYPTIKAGYIRVGWKLKIA